LLTLRIKREETELYPAFILLESGVLYSEVIDFVKEQETKSTQKNVFLFGDNNADLKTLSLALEINGYTVEITPSATTLFDKVKYLQSDLILIDVTNPSKEITSLISDLKREQQNIPLVGYSTSETVKADGIMFEKLDKFISTPIQHIEDFSEQVKTLLNKKVEN